MTRQCANSSCPNKTDSGLCQSCRVEQNWGDSRDYDGDGQRAELRDSEPTDENSHASATLETLRNADDADLETAGIETDEDDEDEEVRCDGGRPTCTDPTCSATAEYAYWMPDMGDFCRVRAPEKPGLEDGDLCPYVCASCRDWRIENGRYEADRFEDPRQRLVTDGGRQPTVEFRELECVSCDVIDEHRIEKFHDDGYARIQCGVCQFDRKESLDALEDDQKLVTDGGTNPTGTDDWGEHEVVVDAVDEVTVVPIECPGCGARFPEPLTNKLAGTTCHECNDEIRYVRRHETRDRGDETEDTTEQTTLMTDGGTTASTSDPATVGVTPPKYQHESYNENLDEWTARGVENPHETDWSPVYYTCKFCPGRGETPGDVDHAAACPVTREIRTDGGHPSILEDDRNGADISDDGEYRYRLWRTWDASKPTLAWIMLNPSTADASEDDPTIRRCLGFAKDWGYGSLVVVNLFALRSTDPSNLRDHPNPVGPENDAHLRDVCDDAAQVVAAWGANGSLQDRAKAVGKMLEADLYALETTKAGHPVHPLYQPADAEPEPWDVAALDSEDDR